MKNSILRSSLTTVLIAVGMSLFVDSAMAQLRPLRYGRNPRTSLRNTGNTGTAENAPEGEDDGRVKIDRFPSPGKASMIKTPEYNVNVNGLQSPVNSRRREWALFEIKYSTSKKWTDELSFVYHLICKGKPTEDGKTFSYYTTTVRYQDIPKGDHMSAVALPPSQVERYGHPVALALEISGRDKVLAVESKTSGMRLPKEWWKDSKVLDDKQMARRQGLVDRSKTPFFLINSDDYEVVQ